MRHIREKPVKKNKYTNLISNTMIFGLGTFGSKVLVFALTPLYTRLLNPEEMNTAVMITSTCNLILPVMYLSVSESVIRFGMDKLYKKSDVFSVGLFTALFGYIVLWCIYPLIGRIEALEGHTNLVYLYVLTSSLRTMAAQFVRATGLVRLFAIDGIFTTATTILFNLLFLIRFRMGTPGFVLSVVAADGLSAVCLFLIMRLHRFVKLRGISRSTVADMLRYCLPMIPTAVFWWITNLSDLYFVRYICGAHINGLYAMAYKIPNLITLVSAFFTQAWQLSAFTEYKGEEGERFFSNVFRSYCAFIMIAASGLILLIKPITRVLLAPEYYEAWAFAPLLIIAVSFSCFVTFLGAVYNAAKKNLMVSVTTFIGAAINIPLNALLIPKWGAQGAAFATLVSFLTVFIIRAIDTRKYIRIRMQPARIILNLVILGAQCAIALTEIPYGIIWEGILFALLTVFNFGFILIVAKRLLSALGGKRAGESTEPRS